MIRRESSQGIGYSVVELHGVRHIFAAAVPREGTTLAGQTRSALRTIEDVVAEEGTRNSIVSQAVFIADGGRIDECHQIIREFYGEHMPATTYVPQHPCQGNLVAIEALGIGGGPGRVEIERHNEQVVTARHGGVAWTHISQIVPQVPAPGVYARSLNAFEQMREKLAAVNVPFDQIIRTWLYLGDIVGPEGETQRYKELNRARSDYYENIRFLAKHVMPGVTETVYPASTGIGTDIRDIIMSCIARHHQARRPGDFGRWRTRFRPRPSTTWPPTVPRAPSSPGPWPSRPANAPRSSSREPLASPSRKASTSKTSRRRRIRLSTTSRR